jgi:GNAT superfamily N-acetyltransferase
MHALIRPLRQDDEPFLWQMLYYAAHMQEDGTTSSDTAKNNPGLQKYVQEWGRETDMGVLALHPHDQSPIGAAWIRLLIEEKKMSSLINDGTPELAIAVLPDYIRQGIGTQLMKHLLEAASKLYPAVMLSVRMSNPARHLYERMGFEAVDIAINRVGSESFVMLIRFH